MRDHPITQPAALPGVGTAHTLGLVPPPQYGMLTNPYSEIGMDFPQYANPYMQKKAMKAYWKQQKYLAKYGGMFQPAPMGIQPPMAMPAMQPGMGGMFNEAENPQPNQTQNKKRQQ